jgi:hypothetical protein
MDEQRNIQTQLAAAFADADIEWRLQWNDEANDNGIAVPYVTNRAIQNRLDQVFGVSGWKNEYHPWHGDGKKNAQLCGISAWFDDRGEWVTKYDGADDSDIEPIKGGLSDSMKRAAVQWGVGRYLYEMDTVFVSTEKRGRTTVIKRSEQGKLDKAHRDHAARFFGQSPAAPSGKPQEPAQARPAISSPQRQQAVPPTQPPARDNTAAMPGAYLVINTAPMPSVKRGNDTTLQLKDGAGQVIQAIMQGANPALVPGIWITGAKIKTIERDGVVFHILESFEISTQNAA